MAGDGVTASRTRTKASTGLKIERVWTTEGVHPYDEVTWERRDVVMTNWRDGSINFEQRGVEFPESWSVNAANIVTTKYFRGAVGTPEREWSLRQLIDRVVSTYRAAGEEHGYFATPADAEVFGHELTWMLLHQVFSFNSPVWFNVGTPSPQQVSACLPYDSLVSTPGGLVPIGKLVEGNAVGAKVYDSNGLTRIVAVKANGVREVVRLHTKAGYQLDVTPDHVVWKSTGDGTGQWVEAGTLAPGDKLEWHRTYAYGESEIDLREIREAALAGWLQSDGFVGQYDEGTNRSLTIEAMTVNDDELDWVTVTLDEVFGGAHRHERTVTTQSDELDCRRTRLYGEHLRPFVQKWDLLTRGVEMEVPRQLFTAPLPVVAAYLRSIFQAEGYVSAREHSTLVAVDMVSEKLIRGVQSLLLRFGIFSRVAHKPDPRPNRKGCWSVRIQNDGDRDLFATHIGFVGAEKMAKLEQSFAKAGRSAGGVKRLEIDRIEPLGAMEVYDIQTESGEFLAGNLRVHNCFILSVDDSMDSILDWYKEEGLIFKGGSGSGVNLSRIRSSRELLSSGGTASGPVSFMRGADASAGTIKSGGATRRAAKMVILDVDHPDIEEFVITKAREEDKIRALRDAGFDMDLGGNDIVSVQYQNANNSVRVSDEFMSAVENGGGFDLRGRLDGQTIETIDAKKLFRTIAQAAWECADPGLQYDDTINDWHTCPETGRITASNPCSEYLHLDNSSCNLASLNLMKFLRADGGFEVEKFVRSVEFVITAMDISICFADFPTERIGETTRAYRQLGIGYANLGALLMASGLPYDSEQGRSVAAAITSLMTGTAYRRSAELAGIVGAYDGYARNAEPHKRVMRKHAAANDEIKPTGTVATAIVREATKQWTQGNKIGDKHGWRNSQAAVLAPTGTIGLMMDCDTTGVEPDLALVKFKKLVGGGSMQIVNQTVPRALRSLGYPEEQVEAIVEHIADHGHVVDAPGLKPEHYPVFDCAMGERSIAPMGHVRMMAAVQPFISGAISKCVVGETLVASGDGLVRMGSLYQGEAEDTFRTEFLKISSLDGDRKTDAFYYGGVRPVRTVTLRSGHSVTGTYPHRLLTAGDGGLVWKTLGELQPGDHVATQYGADLWSSVPASLRDVVTSRSYGNQRAVTLPQEMTEELAFLLGAYAAEGHTSRSNWTITITNSVDSVLERIQAAWQSVFGLTARIDRQPGKCPGVVLSSKSVVEFMTELGCGSRASEKRIPDAVLRSPRDMVLAFLRGLALDAYVTTATAPKWAICLDSPALLDDLQAVLTNLGVVHGRVSKFNSEYGKSYDEVYAAGYQGQLLVSMVPFLEPEKAAAAARYLAQSYGTGTADVVPGITGRELYDLIPAGRPGRDGVRGDRSSFAFLLDERTTHVTRRTVERVASLDGVVLPGWLRQVLDGNLHFSPVDSVVDAGEREVFDLSVPETHAFVANGIMNHNTVNMPEQATVEDVEKIYFEGWKLGLKALAIYRDNCKVGQPLSVAKPNKATASVEAPAEAEKAVEKVVEKVVEYRPVRKRLPKKRPSETVSFSVGGAEGYLTASSYPDDGLGEVFLKMSKQGSTLAGVMDAFSVAISIGLQYGVPLETYVSKFTNMRFEPAGMTDDPDVRMAASVMDYIFRRLALDFLPYERRAELGIFTAKERAAQLRAEAEAESATVSGADLTAMAASAPVESPETATPGQPATVGAVAQPTQELADVAAAKPAPSVGSSTELLEAVIGKAADAPLCFTCGTKMRPAGSCYVCEGCGSTSGCS
ncbi:vitamin B12-dependent ribonucleotide reductase [Micromonospora sp. WMMD956]|uniref:vitamin B12-dependent ribonucleotide reductase n=1 Tax=Micromonospora sp. WMMD956 TaxID=3016108 RepID=UPI002415F33B|nr:vitamin B12-dependent ribonucleotide reductase [Micromonospora sp. WMMD956]MDG4818090.1 vitamin B12-dependent ribonucleotide reductase [Micromonospora sp. WMMD956]